MTLSNEVDASSRVEFSPKILESIDAMLDQYSSNELKHIMKDVAALMDKPHEYEPFAEQVAFHKSVAKTVLVIAGNRSGKSECGARELVWRLLGTHPWKKTKVPIKAWVAGNSFKQIGKVLWPKIKGYMEPRHVAKTRRNSEGYIDRVELVNGSTIDFKTYKQDTMDWESEDLDYLWGDEPPPRQHWQAAQRGLVDRGGHSLITATPLREPWIHEEIWEKAGKAGYDVATFQWSSYANPHTDHEALRRFEMTLTPEERATRIRGEFKKLIGRVLNHFDVDGPSMIRTFAWPKGWPYFEGIDPHMSKPHGVIRLGMTPKKNLVLFHAERPAGDMKDLGEYVLQTRPNAEAPYMDAIVDTSINVFDNANGKTLREQLGDAGVTCILADKMDNLKPGLMMMNRLFYHSKMKQRKGLYVMECCGKFVEEAKKLVWDERKEDTPKGDDDLIDPTRYVIQYDPWNILEAKVIHSKYSTSYTERKPSKGTRFDGQDSRKYSNKRFDRDLDDDEDKPRRIVRY